MNFVCHNYIYIVTEGLVMKKLLTAAVFMALVLSFSAIGLAHGGHCGENRGGGGYHCW